MACHSLIRTSISTKPSLLLKHFVPIHGGCHHVRNIHRCLPSGCAISGQRPLLVTSLMSARCYSQRQYIKRDGLDALPVRQSPCHTSTRHLWTLSSNLRYHIHCYHGNHQCPHQSRTLCIQTIQEKKPLTSGRDLTAKARAMLGNLDMHLSVEKWREIKDDFLKSQPNPRFEHFAMHYVTHLAYYKMGLSMFEFMLADRLLVTENLIGTYLHMCVENKEGAHVMKWYDSWRERKLEIKPNLHAIIIRGICITPHWRRSLELLREQPQSKTYHTVITTACQHGDTDLVTTLVREMQDGDMDIFYLTVVELLQMVQSDTACYVPDALREGVHKAVVEMLERHREQRSFPTWNVIEMLQNYFKRPYGSEGETWHTRLTSVRRDGTCDACDLKLEPLEISAEEFEELRRQLMEKVIKGSDIYRQTTPEELEAFLDFVNAGAPYDVIIDGLNVAYTSRLAASRRYKILLDLVEYLVKGRSLKCLVLGRHHMTQSNKGGYIKKTMELADCFFTQNVSEDDPFMLYATLHSGPDAYYITQDLLRDHKFLLGDDMKAIFERWQRSRQIKLKLVNAAKGKIAFQAIRPYDTVVQRSSQAWHIPYDDGTLQYSYDLPKRWLCAARLL